jgi:protein ImuA
LSSKTAILEGLKARIQRLELGESFRGRAQAVLPFGVPEIDACWPEGFPIAALHEVCGAPSAAGFAAAGAFTAALAARLKRNVLWCTTGHELYAPGLAGFGLHPRNLLIATARTEADVLAVMEEGLRHPSLACVIGETAKLELTASRRLQLAAEKSGVMCVSLRKPHRGLEPIAATSRWRISPMPAAPHIIPQAGRARWRVELTRARSGLTGSWIVEAPNAQGYLYLSSELADRGTGETFTDVRRRAG